MASLLTITGSPMAGNPVNANVTADSPAGDITFHQLKFKVTSRRWNGTDKEYTFTKPVTNGQRVEVDICTALQAAYADYEYTAEPPESYPCIVYSVAVRDEYVLNGETHNSTWTELTGQYALMGEFSDMERLLSGGSKSPTRLTRKPTTSPEVVGVGETHIRPANYTSASAGQVIQQTAIDDEGLQTVNGVQVYAVVATRDRYQLRFINSLGAMESLSVCTLRKTETGIKTDQQVIARHETFGSFSRGVVYKQDDHEVWKMSSGPLDEAWQSWFVHEFLMTEHCWIKVGANWLPVHVLPDKTVSGLDRQNASLLEVNFSLQFDIAGSVMSALAI